MKVKYFPDRYYADMKVLGGTILQMHFIAIPYPNIIRKTLGKSL